MRLGINDQRVGVNARRGGDGNPTAPGAAEFQEEDILEGVQVRGKETA
jgi:hypothetical protein